MYQLLANQENKEQILLLIIPARSKGKTACRETVPDSPKQDAKCCFISGGLITTQIGSIKQDAVEKQEINCGAP